MKSKITMIGAACMLGLSAVAAPVSPEQALGRIAGGGPAKVRSMMKSTPVLSYTARDAREWRRRMCSLRRMASVLQYSLQMTVLFQCSDIPTAASSMPPRCRRQ